VPVKGHSQCCGREGSRRSGVALAMRHKVKLVYSSTGSVA